MKTTEGGIWAPAREERGWIRRLTPLPRHSRKAPRWAGTLYLPYSLICSFQKEKSVRRRSTAFAFFCLLPKHNKIKSRPNPLPHKFTFSAAHAICRKSLPPGCLPRLVITLGLCKLQGVLDLTGLTVMTVQLLSLPSASLSLVLGKVPV